MEVIPGSHRHGQVDFDQSSVEENNVLGQSVHDARQYGGEPVALAMKAGQIPLHTDLLLHGSEPNTSSRRRCGLTMRYFSLDVNFCTAVGRESSASGSHKLFWAHGENTGRNVIRRPCDDTGPIPLPASAARL